MISTTPNSTDGASRVGSDQDTNPPTADTGANPPTDSGPVTGPGGSRHRLFYVLALVAAFGLVAAALTWWITSEVTVQLSIDGTVEPVDTRADTVGQLLADREISVVESDHVSPPVDSTLTDGELVEVRFARTLTVTIDGVETDHTTTERTVGAALAGIDAPTEGAAVSASADEPLPRGGASVTIITPKPVHLKIGGTTHKVTSTDATVADLLTAANITLSPTDKLSPDRTTAVTKNMTVTVTRIEITEEVRTEPVAHETVKRDDSDLTVGTTRTATQGVDGSKEVTYQITTTNGDITDEKVVSETVITEPVTEVIMVGTKPKPVAAPVASPGGAAGGLNWAALAQCESSGNPRAVNPIGYYGLYQFSLATWASVGGSGNPIDASATEQTNRAQILYNKAGAGQWPHCGKYLFS